MMDFLALNNNLYTHSSSFLQFNSQHDEHFNQFLFLYSSVSAMIKIFTLSQKLPIEFALINAIKALSLPFRMNY